MRRLLLRYKLFGKSMAVLFPVLLFAQTLTDPVKFHSEKEYFRALENADESYFRQHFEADFLLLLNEDQQKRYDSLKRLAEKKAYLTRYWQAANPNPLQQENLWLRQFLQRRSYALKHFPQSWPPFYDDRGKYYLKYGKPKFRYEEPGGPKRMEFYWNKQTQHVVRNRNSYLTFDNETWIYDNVVDDFIVYFRRAGAVYRKVDRLYDVVDIGRGKEYLEIKYWIWADLVKSRAGMGHSLSEATAKIRWLEDILVHASGLNRRTSLLADVQTAPETILYSQAQELEARIEKSHLEAPPSALDAPPREKVLQFEPRITQFRDTRGNTRLEITYLIPMKNNLDAFKKKYKKDVFFLSFATLARDSDFRPIVMDSVRQPVSWKQLKKAKFENALGRLSLSLPPQPIELTLQAATENNEKLGFSRRMFDVRDFRGDTLQISDIQFLTPLPLEYPEAYLPVLRRRNLRLVPYPSLRVQKSLPLFLYFEIYHLPKSDMQRNLEIAYTIRSKKEGSSILQKISRLLSAKAGEEISISLQQTQLASAATARELIELDLRSLSEGEYVLEITVTDARRPGIPVRRIRPLIVGKR